MLEEEKIQTEMVHKLEEEIERLEGVVRNMKRKLASLRRAREMDIRDEERERKGEAEAGEDLEDVLEGNLGRGWGDVL